MVRRPARSLHALTFLLAGGAAFAAAQTPASGPEPDLQSRDWVFAAEDHPVAVRKVPGQVRIFILEDLQRSGARDLGEFLAGELPSEFAGEGGPGLRTRAFLGGTRPEDTLVLLDGVRISDPGQIGADLTQISLLGIVRVEVISGPQSARLGTGASGGVVALFSGRDPGREGGSGEIAGRGGSNGQGGGRALPGFGWSQGYLRVGNASGQQDQTTPTDQPFRYSSTFLNLGQRFGGFGITLDYRNTYQGIPDPYATATEIARTYDASREARQRISTSHIGFSWQVSPRGVLQVDLGHAQYSHLTPPPSNSGLEPTDGKSDSLSLGLRYGLGRVGLGVSLQGSQDRLDQPGSISGTDQAKARHAALGLELNLDLGTAARLVLNARNGFDDQDLTLARGGTQFQRETSTAYQASLQVDLGLGVRAYAGGGRGYAAPLLGQALINANNGGTALRTESSNYSLLGLAYGKGTFYSRVEANRSLTQDVVDYNGTNFTNGGRIRVQGVQTTVGFKIRGVWGMEGFVRAQEAKDLSAPAGQQYQTVPVAGRPFSSHGIKIFAGGGVWRLDLKYQLVGHRYEWVGDYTCDGLAPNVIDTDVVYRDLSAVGSLSLGKHVTLYFRGEHLLQPKIDIQQWLAKVPDGKNDAARVYGIPAPAPTGSLEVVFRY